MVRSAIILWPPSAPHRRSQALAAMRRHLRQAGLRACEGVSALLAPTPDAPPSRTVRARHLCFHDATLRPSGWLLRSEKALAHPYSPTVAGAAGELRHMPRTPFPFHPLAEPNGHLLHRYGYPKPAWLQTNPTIIRLALIRAVRYDGQQKSNQFPGEEYRRFLRQRGGSERNTLVPNGRLHPTPGIANHVSGPVF